MVGYKHIYCIQKVRGIPLLVKQKIMTARELAEVLLLYEDHEVKIDTPLGQFSVGDIEEDEDLNGDIVVIEATTMTDDVK